MPTTNDLNVDVVLREHEAKGGLILAEVQLNVPATLNSLSLDMARTLRKALKAWAQDAQVAAVLFTGAGERAFCAGGDIQALYRALVKNRAAGRTVDNYPFDFFAQEYRLDHQIHTFPKPVVSLGHGVVMGGGLGIFSASRFRVVTERSRLAYPEITIGLFPDAGGTALLRSLAPHLATFLGCTGAHCNGADALAMGLGTHSIAGGKRTALRDALLAIPYVGDGSDAQRIDAALAALPTATLPPAQVGAVPESLGEEGDYPTILARLRQLPAEGWLGKAVATMERGCPTSLGLVIEQLRRAPGLSLADCFRMEMVIAAHCALNTDFVEGVRALLIDKDNAPKWRFGDLDGVQWDHVLSHFAPPWPEHPLADLQ